MKQEIEMATGLIVPRQTSGEEWRIIFGCVPHVFSLLIANSMSWDSHIPREGMQNPEPLCQVAPPEPLAGWRAGPE